jgi:hypothetical protein
LILHGELRSEEAPEHQLEEHRTCITCNFRPVPNRELCGYLGMDHNVRGYNLQKAMSKVVLQERMECKSMSSKAVKEGISANKSKTRVQLEVTALSAAWFQDSSSSASSSSP